MATDDRQILVAGTAGAPAQFLVPGNGQVRPKTVYATFDGTGAAVAFLPILEVFSDGGQLIGRYKAESTVAAGASADVSWFPGVKPAAAAVSAAGLPVAEIRQRVGSPTTITSAVLPQYTSLQDGINADFATTDATVFDNSSTTLFTGLPLFGIGVLVPGTYRYDFNQFCQVNGTAGNKLTAYWSSSGTALLSSLQQGRVQCTMNDVWDANATNHLFWTEWQSFVLPADVPGVAVPYGKRSGGANPQVVYQIIITQISPTPITDL